jgi:hypothetical protein
VINILNYFFYSSLSLVTPTSKCTLRVFSHSTFRKDVLLGETRIDIHKQLVKEQGKFDKTNLALDVKVGKQIFLF